MQRPPNRAARWQVCYIWFYVCISIVFSLMCFVLRVPQKSHIMDKDGENYSEIASLSSAATFPTPRPGFLILWWIRRQMRPTGAVRAVQCRFREKRTRHRQVCCSECGRSKLTYDSFKSRRPFTEHYFFEQYLEYFRLDCTVYLGFPGNLTEYVSTHGAKSDI